MTDASPVVPGQGFLLLVTEHLATIVGFVLALLLVSRVLRQHTRPATSIAWFLFMVLAPYVGVPAYLVFGGRKLRQLAGRKPPLYAPGVLPDIAEVPNDIARRLTACAMPPPRADNALQMITDGGIAYARLLALIEHATHSIHLTTFILANDVVGRVIVERLAARARAGVEVRVLVDALGSLPIRFMRLQRLRRAGAQVGIFMPVLPLHRRWSANLRNHRKMAIFDGDIALTGGMNLAAEYMGPAATPARWIDTCVEVRGPAVADLATVFARDWQFATREALPLPAPGLPAGETTLQVVPNGPDVAGDPFYDVLTSAIYNARQRIWIVTPYFVPDEGLLRALTLQARVGVDVRVVLPRRSNHRVADFARNRLLRDLAEAGVRVFLHPRTMIHAKLIVIDERVAISGSVNMDARSLYLNYELALFAYGATAAGRGAEWIEQLMAACDEGQPATPGRIGRWAEDLSWLLSPLI
jgi:cardiolipin synthase